ncbi:putative membrane protein [Weissella oryzae SG25]|uniref:Phosphatidylglycerol lysyltransferase n=1 Tax=Weissella oryzae (strain DSM 25784 / JCM 18191 / LMG 30913 / SG25) TaxID=1329250 RepID=A0A069D227_WEIOS|nr:lysylphosphatidylglycerol synthase transmembrane domain-containing protein [Weissella oryzae]GAK31436.1 putative membrane protein [Weissella oryzae SG25]
MSRRNRYVFIVMLLIGLGIFYWSFRTVNLKQAWLTIEHANWGWLSVAILAMIIYLLMEAVVVKVFVDTQHAKLSWLQAIRVPLVEQFGNGITPFSTGGQPMQLIALTQAGVDAGRASSILLMKFVVYQGMIVVNFILALIVGYQYVQDKLHAWSIFILFGFLVHLFVILTLLLVMYWPAFTRSILLGILLPVKWINKKTYLRWKQVLAEKIDNFHEESRRISRDWLALTKTIGLTFLQLFFYNLIPYFILLGLGATQAHIILVTALNIIIVMIISLFPIPGGAGGAEIGFGLLFSPFLSPAVLILAMMIWRLITYYFGMFAGIIAFGFDGKK